MHLFSWSSGFWALRAGGHFSLFLGQWWQQGAHTLFLSSESRGILIALNAASGRSLIEKIPKNRMVWNKICDNITVLLELIALAWRAFATGVRCNPGAGLPFAFWGIYFGTGGRRCVVCAWIVFDTDPEGGTMLLFPRSNTVCIFKTYGFCGICCMSVDKCMCVQRDCASKGKVKWISLFHLPYHQVQAFLENLISLFLCQLILSKYM